MKINNNTLYKIFFYICIISFFVLNIMFAKIEHYSDNICNAVTSKEEIISEEEGIKQESEADYDLSKSSTILNGKDNGNLLNALEENIYGSLEENKLKFSIHTK